MAFIRQYIAPLFTLIIFLIALVVVSARIFLPSDMAIPAPTEDLEITSDASGSFESETPNLEKN
ncbi:MAG: hypothetical protein QNJ54_14190 [Prochloraceae cyanobacterium]|nr:hypothetical protein [Prochloraceae cyanobacterium]